MKNLENDFRKILEGTGGNNTSNSDIIDYQNGSSISKEEIEDEYANYLDLIDEIDNYIEENDLDDVSDKNEIKKHFSNIDDDCFEFNQACLKNFDDYMIAKINNKNENIRKANIMFNKNGNGNDTTRITIPVTWAKKAGFTKDNRSAIIELNNNEIIIKKEVDN